MDAKKITGLKRFVIISAVLSAVVVIKNGSVQAGSSNPVFFDRKQQQPFSVIVAQHQTQTSSEENAADSPEGQESGSKPDDPKDSKAKGKKPLKDFRPSERIEADQAVDFPYDI